MEPNAIVRRWRRRRHSRSPRGQLPPSARRRPTASRATPHECRTAGPGDVVMLPKVMPHTWRAYGDDPIRFQVTVTPGEFETFFERIVERKLTLADQAELVEVASAAGMDIIGLPLSDEEVAAIVGGGRV